MFDRPKYLGAGYIYLTGDDGKRTGDKIVMSFYASKKKRFIKVTTTREYDSNVEHYQDLCERKWARNWLLDIDSDPYISVPVEEPSEFLLGKWDEVKNRKSCSTKAI
jgi:hypothetical protein